MISQIDPIVRLDLLREYMNERIDKLPERVLDFDIWIYIYYESLIPGTPKYFRRIATHCYYCGMKFIPQDEKLSPTIDHWVPLSKGKTERLVICCSHCNSCKSNEVPNKFVQRITKAHLNGRSVFGLNERVVKVLFKAVHEIANNIKYNIGPKVYYIKK